MFAHHVDYSKGCEIRKTERKALGKLGRMGFDGGINPRPAQAHIHPFPEPNNADAAAKQTPHKSMKGKALPRTTSGTAESPTNPIDTAWLPAR